jgi:FixJ family two-component response regulator
MPILDGTESLHRGRLERVNLHVIVIPGHHDDEIQWIALQAGASKFLIFDASEVLVAVNPAISRCPNGRPTPVEARMQKQRKMVIPR